MRAATFPCLPLAVAGFVLCQFALFMPEMPFCTGSGCEIYRDFSFLGLSFYFWGSILFAVLGISAGRCWYSKMSLLALAADLPFLAWQAAFIPCSNCLIVSALLVLNARYACASAQAGARVPKYSKTLISCAALFIVFGAVSVVKESVPPWKIFNNAGARTIVYFSPTCEPCLVHIAELHRNNELQKVSLAPVARSGEDLLLLRILTQIRNTDGELAMVDALLLGKNVLPNREMSLLDGFLLDLRLHWNLSNLARQGGSSLPWLSGQPITATPRKPSPTSGWKTSTPSLCGPDNGCGVLE